MSIILDGTTGIAQPSITSAFGVPVGTTAQRPDPAAEGMIRFNTDSSSLEFYDGANWIRTNVIPFIVSVTGSIYAGSASILTITATNASDVVTVRFSEGGTTIADVTDVVFTAGSGDVTVPSAVYGQTLGDTIAVSIISSNGVPSSNSVSKTVSPLPTGGTITFVDGYRYHTFTSSGDLVVPSGFTASADYLIVAGGGSGGGSYGNGDGGGGAGGYRTGSTTISVGTLAVVVGAGGGVRSNGSTSSFSGVSSTGGGYGGAYFGVGANSGGSGGGGRGGGPDDAGGGPGGGTSGQGNAGGSQAHYNGGDTQGGGGGGASAVGGSAGGGGAGSGGAGSNWQSLGTYYAGGGGGGSRARAQGSGGAGGGGNYNANGSANTGGGGGASGAGGSGVVIVRYAL